MIINSSTIIKLIDFEMSRIGTMLAFFLACLLACLAEGKGRTKFVMEEFREIDMDRHLYETIVDEDIWVYDVVTKIGVLNLTAELYTERVLPHKAGDTPWYICIVSPGMAKPYWHSTYLMKSLYFL